MRNSAGLYNDGLTSTNPGACTNNGQVSHLGKLFHNSVAHMIDSDYVDLQPGQCLF